jgi:hypothetical protein
MPINIDILQKLVEQLEDLTEQFKKNGKLDDYIVNYINIFEKILMFKAREAGKERAEYAVRNIMDEIIKDIQRISGNGTFDDVNRELQNLQNLFKQKAKKYRQERFSKEEIYGLYNSQKKLEKMGLVQLINKVLNIGKYRYSQDGQLIVVPKFTKTEVIEDFKTGSYKTIMDKYGKYLESMDVKDEFSIKMPSMDQYTKSYKRYRYGVIETPLTGPNVKHVNKGSVVSLVPVFQLHHIYIFYNFWYIGP